MRTSICNRVYATGFGSIWNLDEIGALCVRLGAPKSVDYTSSGPKRLNLARLATRGVLVLITGAFLVISFLPLPPPNS